MRSNRAVTPDRILQTGLGSWGSKALLSAVELGVFTGLSRGGKDLAQLVQDHGLHPRSAREFFDALVALGFLDRRDGIYSNTAEAAEFLDRRQPTYLGNVLEMANARLDRSWNELSEGLRTGPPENEVDTDDPFGELCAEPLRLREFLSAMTELSRAANRAIARRLPWWDYKTFVDVGTAQGDLAVQVALANPHLRGTGVDLPAIAPIFLDHAAGEGVTDRLTFVSGDLLADPLPKADVLLMGHGLFLHDCDAESRQALVSKAYEALPRNGTLVVYENSMDPACGNGAFALFASLDQLIQARGEGSVPGAAWRRWMQAAGFCHSRVEPLAESEFIVIARK
jgi:hypothetical protein